MSAGLHIEESVQIDRPPAEIVRSGLKKDLGKLKTLLDNGR
jgi:hypothetical protein